VVLCIYSHGALLVSVSTFVLFPGGENLSLKQNVEVSKIILTRIDPDADFLHALQLHSKVSKNPLRGFTIHLHNHDLDLIFLNS
jgi:hypothetical protein